jgi:hypothetical protein
MASEYKIIKNIYLGYAVFEKVALGFSGERFFYQQVSDWYIRKTSANNFIQNKIIKKEKAKAI